MSKNCIQKHGEEYEILSLYTFNFKLSEKQLWKMSE